MSVWNEHACSVHLKRTETVEQALSALAAYPDDSIKHAVLGGHGSGTYLVWGGAPEGLLGVQKGGYGVRVGEVVQVMQGFFTITALRVWITAGTRGYIAEVDHEGDMKVIFEGHAQQWVQYSDRWKLKVLPSVSLSREFLLKLGRKMQRHGSIFTDSCLSATSQVTPNLASFVAQIVGKGVRVIGSEVSFGKVRVKRFHAWYAQIDTNEMSGAQRTYQEGATCPSFSARRRPDREGNCRCRRGARCTTDHGNLCPAAGGQTSYTKFLPFCGESWAQERCDCSVTVLRFAACCPWQLLALLLLVTALLAPEKWS